MIDVKLIEVGIIHEKKTSHSGLELDWRWDLDRLSNDAKDDLTEALDDLTRGCTVAGIERGGTRLTLTTDVSAILSVRHDKSIVIETQLCHWECSLRDDVVTTGRSMIDAEKALGKHGIKVVQRVCVLDRREEWPSDHCPFAEYEDHPTFCSPPCIDTNLEITSLFMTADLVEAGLVPDTKGTS